MWMTPAHPVAGHSPSPRPEVMRTMERDARQASSGWLTFAAAYLVIAALMNLIWGLTALTKQDYFHQGGLVWSSLNPWGWIALIAAVAQIITAALVAGRWTGGMLMAIVV